MSKMHDDEAAAIAAFLRKKGATVVDAAPAYGVNPEVDKERAKERRHLARVQSAVPSERAYERYAEDVNDAYMSGGSRARDEVMARGVSAYEDDEHDDTRPKSRLAASSWR